MCLTTVIVYWAVSTFKTWATYTNNVPERLLCTFCCCCWSAICAINASVSTWSETGCKIFFAVCVSPFRALSPDLCHALSPISPLHTGVSLKLCHVPAKSWVACWSMAYSKFMTIELIMGPNYTKFNTKHPWVQSHTSNIESIRWIVQEIGEGRCTYNQRCLLLAEIK